MRPAAEARSRGGQGRGWWEIRNGGFCFAKSETSCGLGCRRGSSHHYGYFNSGLGGFFSLAMDPRAFSSDVVWFAPLLGEGKQS
jgi:hypothetical protein